jgi:hypothetical protein
MGRLLPRLNRSLDHDTIGEMNKGPAELAPQGLSLSEQDFARITQHLRELRTFSGTCLGIGLVGLDLDLVRIYV